ncbi:hypothetical protein LINGRAHAP2_LOCUS14753 [Linum grandiflorum]
MACENRVRSESPCQADVSQTSLPTTSTQLIGDISSQPLSNIARGRRRRPRRRNLKNKRKEEIDVVWLMTTMLQKGY